MYLSWPVKLGGKKVLKAQPKTYIADAAIRNAVLMDDDAICALSDESSAAIVITKSPTDYGIHNAPNGNKLIRIPAYAFLYLLGHAEKNGYKGKIE